MPAFKRASKIKTITLPQRSAIVAAETDVLVIGGGPAGLGAALGAAHEGAQVILAEHYGFLGGTATAALVTIMTSYYTEHHRAERLGVDSLLPTDHGAGKPVIEGVLATLVHRIECAGGAFMPSIKTGYTVPFDPEVFKLVAQDMLDEAGVHMLFHAFASGIVGEERTEGVIFETKSGPVVIRAKVIIDCTGDGDIAASAGAPYELGRHKDGLVQPMTLMFRMGDYDKDAFSEYIKKHPNEWRGVHGLWDLIRQATETGELKLPREDILFFATPHGKELIINSSRVKKVLGIDVWDLTYAEWLGRRQIHEIATFLKKYVPGFGKSYILQAGTQIGIRETRRIIGDYKLTEDDILSAKKFDDVIARGTYPIDIHNPKGKGTILKRLPAGEAYDIPLRCLIPKNTENILVAGRCISGTHEAHASYRVMPICVATGQASGVCAALAAKHNIIPRQVNIRDVQKSLKNQKANLRDRT
ncbi:MAG: FAD-dependent oxidoreductase [Candidatus Margulisiibacteriota bacterium]|nr:MAG: FAD-dependent oxidoreductase [Candidatus Margulisbacteria bacterium GWD2_39_127]OGI01660.1 MAG: FAD-dependent oxidoreductase [Candidatus Margulisbacteria bacterium GWF2_38_17]OGI05865.1 MAG: FAD-dependent oxidoreductase [Candidatus Margulisbacteria bacterium GWE2_39_32]PZM83859.1 MAG: FAD-dependent oxidoreductase [Candidatus Margulisiibacteriota bacterium]HAR63625.1 FAD-dependent oxidoreductase [Candidatus Margulisiibacteriota bacterium]